VFEIGVVLDVPMRLTTPSAMGLTTLTLICVCVWKDGPKLDCRVRTIDGVVLYGQYESANPGVRTSSTSMVTAKDNTTSTKLRLRTLQTFVDFTTVNADIPDGDEDVSAEIANHGTDIQPIDGQRPTLNRKRPLQPFVSFATVSTETPDSDEDVSAKIANNERDIQPTDEQRHALNCNPAPTLSSGVADVTRLTALAAASDAPTLARTLKKALTKIQVSTRPPDFSGYKSDHLQPKHGRTQSPPTATKFRNANGARSAQSNWHFRQISRHTRDGRQQHSQQAARLQSHHGFRSDSLNSRPKPSARTRQSTRTHPMAAEFATYWKFESFQDHDIEFRGALW